MNTEQGLEPCPFCGDPMILEAGNFGHTAAFQDALPEAARCLLRHTAYPEEVRTLWNTRALSPQDRIKELEEALTPSGDTKAAYIGEFRFAVELYHPRLGSETRTVEVPWTTIKEIMAAIRARAALHTKGGQ